MTLSTTAFGIYFYMMAHHNPASGEPQTNLAWLALASTGVFITGEISHFHEKSFDFRSRQLEESFKMILVNLDPLSFFII